VRLERGGEEWGGVGESEVSGVLRGRGSGGRQCQQKPITSRVHVVACKEKSHQEWGMSWQERPGQIGKVQSRLEF